MDADAASKDAFVRLLVAPGYRVATFWVLLGDQPGKVLVIDAPPNGSRLEAGKFYAEDDFLQTLVLDETARAIPSSG